MKGDFGIKGVKLTGFRNPAILGAWVGTTPRGPPGGFGKRAAFYVCVRGPGTGVDGTLASGIQSGPTTQFTRL